MGEALRASARTEVWMRAGARTERELAARWVTRCVLACAWMGETTRDARTRMGLGRGRRASVFPCFLDFDNVDPVFQLQFKSLPVLFQI